MFLFLSFLLSLSEEFGIVSSIMLGLLCTASLESYTMSLALKHDRGNEALNLRSLVTLLLSLLWWEWALNNVLSDVILLGQIEQFSDMGGSLGSQTTGNADVGQSSDFLLSLLHHGERQSTQVSVDDAPTNRFSLSLTTTAWTVARVSLGEQKTNSNICENTLLHWKSLLIVSTGNPEYITLPVISQTISLYFSSHTFLIKDTEFVLIVLLEYLLSPGRRNSHV
jgi:hypothetical protein